MTQIRLSMIKEVAHGIKGFFDAFIGTQLLYNNERVSELTEILFESILRSLLPVLLTLLIINVTFILQVQFHDEILKDTSGKAPSDIYGSAHLLRLMVRIGGLLDRYNIR